MLRQTSKLQKFIGLVAVLLSFATPSFALDTDIYQPNVKQNCYILLDTSGSMGFGVYESNIDYDDLYDYYWRFNSAGNTDYVNDSEGDQRSNHFDKNSIYLVTHKSDSSYKLRVVASPDGETIFTGDAANPSIEWDTASTFDTGVDLDVIEAGNGNTILDVDENLHITFANQTATLGVLPKSQDIELTHEQNLYGGAVIKDGFVDLLKAPGYYFSGFNSRTLDDTYIYSYDVDSENPPYFFVTGNWLNMQQVYNLYYTTNNPAAAGAKQYDDVWKFEYWPEVSNPWQQINYSYSYPENGISYEPDIEVSKTIKYFGANQIKLHFSSIDVNPTTSGGDKGDFLIIKDGDGNEINTYYGTLGDITTDAIPGNTAIITLKTDSDNSGTGYTLDSYEVTPYGEEGYKIKDRLTIAESSMLNTIEEFRGEINWGTFTFDNGDGAKSQQVINPNLTDDATRQNIASNFSNIVAAGGTPIGEALQDVFEVGYYLHRHAIDNLVCRKNYAIVLSDGFPSLDFDWERIGGVAKFSDSDSDNFTADPAQYPSPYDSFYEFDDYVAADVYQYYDELELLNSMPKNYYDDVARWMYTHSWQDKTEVTDPTNSYVNVSSHQISFGFQNALMQDAAEEAGGLYITAYNEGQLNAAFQAIGLAMTDAVSFTAPVVSVDAANKIQNGDDLYMGQFIPMDAGYWPGNLRKFKLGDSSIGQDPWKIYDADGNEATTKVANTDGTYEEVFKDDLVGFWNIESTEYSDLPIHHDGVGEVLTYRVKTKITASPYNRTIKTIIRTDSDSDGEVDTTELISFKRDATTIDDLEKVLGTTGITTDKTINWVHGYTFDADVDGNPVEARDWALGAIVHSRPTVIDYYSDDLSTVELRLIAVGADDGMIHFFLDKDASKLAEDANASFATLDDGSEVFAYIPSMVLSKLKDMEVEGHIPLVDGSVKLFRKEGNPQFLFVGLRRGGRSIIQIDVSSMDPTTWSVKEITTAEIPELGQSWSDITFSKIREPDDSYTDIAIFSGGYDATEDNYPEPFNDLNNDGTPYKDNGIVDGAEWDKTDDTQDVYDDGLYTKSNPDGDSHGRGIFIVKVGTLAPVFSVTYDADNLPSTQNTFSATTAQTRADMKYCFPAAPSVVSLSKVEADGTRVDNVLAAIYAPDIYGNLFRITYDYDKSDVDPGWKWQVHKLFSANSTSSSESSEIWGGDDDTDSGRKVFYGPAVSWRGSGRYFDPSNYVFPAYTFEGTQNIASVFFGTGDRVHPTYQLIKNRVYAIYDDIPVTADSGDIKISPAPYTEDDLLNITCDELGINTLQNDGVDTLDFKTSLQTLLTDDVNNASAIEYPGGATENDAKGWYIILQDQGSDDYCGHCDYAVEVDDLEGGRDYHIGEKVLSKFTLFAGNLYFTTYQPAYDDPCVPEGNAFAYALNYLDGSAGLNLNNDNDLLSGDDPILKDVTDRYGKYTGVKGIPSGFEVVIRDGEAGAMASLGGGIIGGGEDGEFLIPYEDSGISLYYWIEK